MDIPLTQVLENSQSTEVLHRTEEKIQIGILQIGNEKYEIFQGITKIGRQANCEISLQDITVSKIHSEIEANRKNVFICDLNSSNKTRLNDVVLRPNRFYEVNDGATLKFGIIEGSFFYLKSRDETLLVPQTPDANLDLRNKSISDNDSLIRNTPAAEAGKFRRPHLPIQKKLSNQAVIGDPSQVLVAQNHIPNVEIQVQSNKNIQELETQYSAIEFSKRSSENKSHIQDLETQVEGVNNIQDMETQFSDDENETGDFEQELFSSKFNNRNTVSQISESEENIQANSELRQIISGKKMRIQDLETQFNESQSDIQNTRTQVSVFENNQKTIKNMEEGKIHRKRQSEHQKPIEELKAQIFESDALETSVKIDEAEIYDLPTQSNSDYTDNLKKQKELRTSFQSPSSSPDLLGTYNQVIIAESDEETVEEGIFGKLNINGEDESCDIGANINKNMYSDIIYDRDNDKIKKNCGVIVECDEPCVIEDTLDNFGIIERSKRRADSKDNEFEKKGIVSDSDSNDDEEKQNEGLPLHHFNYLKKNKSTLPSQMKDTGQKIVKKGIYRRKPSEKLKSSAQSRSESDFDKDDGGKENDPTSSLKSVSENSTGTNNSESIRENDRTSVNSNNQSDSDTDFDETGEIERQSNSKSSKNNFRNSKSINASKSKNTDIPSTSSVSSNTRDDSKNKKKKRNAPSFDSKNSLDVIEISQTAKLHPETLDLIDAPKSTVEQDYDSDDSCTATTQLIIQPISHSVQNELRKSTHEEILPTQIISTSTESPQNYHSEVDIKMTDADLEPTQKIESQKFQSPVNKQSAVSEEFESTQVLQYFTNSRTNYTSNSDGEETDGDRAPTQKIELPTKFHPQTLLQLSSPKSPTQNTKLQIPNHLKLSKELRQEGIDELPATQILDSSKTHTQLLNNEIFTKTHDVDDTHSTEIPPAISLIETPSIPQITRNQSRIRANESSDNEGTEMPMLYTPSLKISCRSKNLINESSIKRLHGDDDLSGIFTSTPVSFSPTKRRKFSLSLKHRKETESEDGDYHQSEKSVSRETLVNNQQEKKNNSEDSIGKNLDRIFDGAEEVKIDSKTPLMTQQLLEILGPSQSVSSSLRNIEKPIEINNSIKFTNRKKGGKSKIVRKKNSKEKLLENISESSDDEDMDYKKLSAMADRYIAISELEKDPSRSRIERQANDKEAPKIDSFDSHERIENKSPSNERDFHLENVQNQVELSPRKRQMVKEKEGKDSKKSRASAKMNKLLEYKETASIEDKQEADKKVMRKRKLQCNNDGKNFDLPHECENRDRKKMKEDNSDESIIGVESQEIQRILERNENDRIVQCEADRAQLGRKIKRKMGKLKNENSGSLGNFKESPSSTVRTKARSIESDKITYCVLFTGIEDEDEIKTNSVISLGGSVTKDPLKATILVTDKVRRTFKFFCALSRSILIVSVGWLDASVKSRRFLDPKKYHLHDSTAELKFRFSLSKSLSRAKAKKLLEGYTVLLTPKIIGPSISDLKTMIQVSGGKPLVRAPRAWTENTIIVSCEEDLPYVKRIISKIKSTDVHVVSVEFLLSGILRQQLEYKEFSFSL